MSNEELSAARVPADIDRPDRIVAGLTARQVAILAATAAVLYVVWLAVRGSVPGPVFLLVAVPVAAAVVVVALGSRDGVSLDRLLLAGLRQHTLPARRVPTPGDAASAPGWASRLAGTPARVGVLSLPAGDVDTDGVVDLGPDGYAVVAVCSGVPFALRTPAEQQGLVVGFARWLHALSAPVQILIRTHRLDLAPAAAQVRETAAGLPDPALETAARAHADYLEALGTGTDLLARQILLVLREPAPASRSGLTSSRGGRSLQAGRDAAAGRLARRLAETRDLLTAAGVSVTPLDGAAATAILTAACNPDRPDLPDTGLAASDAVITTPWPDTNNETDGDEEWFA